MLGVELLYILFITIKINQINVILLENAYTAFQGFNQMKTGSIRSLAAATKAGSLSNKSPIQSLYYYLYIYDDAVSHSPC